MRIIRGKKLAQQGNMILICVIFSAAMAVTIASYLLLVRSQYISSTRSYDWNMAMTLAEAGVEDALALVNKHVGDFPNLRNWPASAASADHWEADGNVFHARRTPGASLGYYDVWITNLNDSVVIYAEGVAINPATSLSDDGINVRKLLVRAGLQPLFTMAAVAVNNIDLNYNPLLVDSYDSADPLHSFWNTNSTFGVYDPARRKDGGILAANGGIQEIPSAGLKIYGDVLTGPGGLTNAPQNISVGDLTWTGLGIQPGHASDDMNVAWPQVKLPATNFFPVAVGFNPLIITESGYYRVIDSWGLQQNLTVDAPNVVLYLEHGLDYSFGGRTLQVTTNSCLTIYAAEQFNLDRGSAILSTNSGNLYIYGLTNLPFIQLESGTNFTGCIYAPQSALYIGDNHWGSTVTRFLRGSVTAKSITPDDQVILSYDGNLGRIGAGPGGGAPARAFVVTNWTEL